MSLAPQIPSARSLYSKAFEVSITPCLSPSSGKREWPGPGLPNGPHDETLQGVMPMEVSTLRPCRIAAALARFPRWKVIK